MTQKHIKKSSTQAALNPIYKELKKYEPIGASRRIKDSSSLLEACKYQPTKKLIDLAVPAQSFLKVPTVSFELSSNNIHIRNCSSQSSFNKPLTPTAYSQSPSSTREGSSNNLPRKTSRAQMPAERPQKTLDTLEKIVLICEDFKKESEIGEKLAFNYNTQMSSLTDFTDTVIAKSKGEYYENQKVIGSRIAKDYETGENKKISKFKTIYEIQKKKSFRIEKKRFARHSKTLV